MTFSREKLWCIKACDMRISALMHVYAQMETEELADVVFYSGHITGPASFSEFAVRPGIEMRVVFHASAEDEATTHSLEFGPSEACGIVWINNALGKACMVHFCMFRKFWEHQREIGLWVLRQYLEPVNPDTGKPYLSALYGLTPVVYRHAVSFIKGLGFRIVSTIPGACEFKDKHGGVVFRDGVVSILTLKDIQPY